MAGAAFDYDRDLHSNSMVGRNSTCDMQQRWMWSNWDFLACSNRKEDEFYQEQMCRLISFQLKGS